MGKSASCFKICGSDSVDHDDLRNPDSKGSSDRRGWSFRKRSARHRVLSNNVTSEAASSANKESPESPAVNVILQSDLAVPENTSIIQCTKEKAELSPEPDLNLSDTPAAKEDDSRADAALDEHSIIIIQSAIRQFLAQRVLLKQKNVIKLQAAVRGHLVRRHAIGTLCCVQAIIKMQALVRARRARLLVEGSDVFVKQSESCGKDNHDSTISSRKEVNPNGAYTYVSIEKLISNAFARQLMESTPKTKHLNIKCDPLKSDSAWKWLERWMSVSSVSNDETFESGSASEQHEKENFGHSDGKKDVLVPSESAICISGISTSDTGTEIDDNLISFDASNLGLSSSKSVSSSSSHSKQQIVDQSGSIKMKVTDMAGEVEVECLPEKQEWINERDIPDSKTPSTEDIPYSRDSSTEQPEAEAKDVSKKASNPAFIAAKSKFEELSSATKLTNSSSQDHEAESSLNKISLTTGQPSMSKDSALADNAMSNSSGVQNGGSECGTELSISSTLDSPDTSEAGAVTIEHEPIICDGISHTRSREKLELEANGKSGIILESEPSCTDTDKLDMNESINSATGHSLDSMIVADSRGLGKEGADLNDLSLELEPEAKASPEASPRSHVTASESQVTPSSQVSIKTKKNKGEKHESHRKRRSSSTDKKSLSNRNHESASRSSAEQLRKEHKTARRNSVGSAKLDHKEQEPRDSSSSSSLPSYMQATESARAKAIASGSPRSSPDVHDKDVYIKKRQSLPGTNERQVSPNIQRSLSQAQQNARGIGTQSPQDRQWRR